MHFDFRVYDELTIRKNPTTQIAISVAEWPGNSFLLWLPESVGELWNQWTPDAAHQDFEPTASGGLLWQYGKTDQFTLEARLEPAENHLLLEVRIRNLSGKQFEHVTAQNCFHLSRAPDFVCDDFSRVFIRTNEQWQRLSDLSPTCGLPMYYRPGFLESGRRDSWKGHLAKNNQPSRSDHPLMICVDREQRRAVATASDHYQCVFHNSGNAYLRCIHSQQAPVPLLPAGDATTFRQMILFVDGGVEECWEHYERLQSLDMETTR